MARHHLRILRRVKAKGGDQRIVENTRYSWAQDFVAVESGYPVDSLLYHTISYYIYLYFVIFADIYSASCIPGDSQKFTRKIALDDLTISN